MSTTEGKMMNNKSDDMDLDNANRELAQIAEEAAVAEDFPDAADIT